MKTTLIKIVNYISEDKSVKYRLEITQGNPMSFNCYGKTWTKQTQAVLYYNDFIEAYNIITKHQKDPDNLKYAVMTVCKPLISKIHFNEVRRYFWKELLNFVENERTIL